jgi:hypothetical protein
MSFRFAQTAKRFVEFWYESDGPHQVCVGTGGLIGAYKCVASDEDGFHFHTSLPMVLTQSILGTAVGAVAGAVVWATFPVAVPVATATVAYRALTSPAKAPEHQ